MTTFDKRETSFEAKYAHDQETVFKIGARRNKLLGLWMAEHLGLEGADADAYAKQVIASDFESRVTRMCSKKSGLMSRARV